jgi:hypothetical protein
MSKQTSLYEFGYNFLGPLCSEYFFSLQEYQEKHDIDFVGFLAREGYLFERIYQSLLNRSLIRKYNNAYVNASRTFLFRISIADPLTWQWSLGHGFEGSLQKLLVARFGFTLEQVMAVFSEETLQTDWQLPQQRENLENLFEQHIADLDDLVSGSKKAYLSYLASIGISSNRSVLLLDVGYSGTIQKLLSRLLLADINGLYFIATKKGRHQVGDNVASMSSVFKSGVKMGDGHTMLDRSLFLESLLTSPNGQFVDLTLERTNGEEGYSFFYSRRAYTQQSFHELNVVFDGAQQAVVDAFKNKVRYTVSEIDMFYEQYVRKRNMLPRASWPLFDVDDAISGNANVDPLSFFGL